MRQTFLGHDPLPEVLIIASIVFGLCALQLREHRRKFHQYQDCILLAGIATGVLLSVLLAEDGFSWTDKISRFIPICAFIAQLLSLAIHSLAPNWRNEPQADSLVEEEKSSPQCY
jgi:hypothetical protein